MEPTIFKKAEAQILNILKNFEAEIGKKLRNKKTDIFINLRSIWALNLGFHKKVEPTILVVGFL